jgi:hypothetical protein
VVEGVELPSHTQAPPFVHWREEDG